MAESDLPDFLTPEELARRLKVSVAEVVRAAERGELPGLQVAGAWRFSAAQLSRWLGTASPAPPARPAQDRLPEGLQELLRPDHIVPALAAHNSQEVIEEIASTAHRQELVNSKSWFAGALAEREAMLSTAVEGGLAFLHARRARTDNVVRPFVLLARSPCGVAFGAPDGAPTHLFFVLGLKYDRLHLRWLSRLARILGAADVVEALCAAPDAPAMHELLVGRDEQVPHRAP